MVAFDLPVNVFWHSLASFGLLGLSLLHPLRAPSPAEAKCKTWREREREREREKEREREREKKKEIKKEIKTERDM